MSTRLQTTLLFSLFILATAKAQTPAFNSGSDGSDGALNVTEDTAIALPADGVLNYTTITVASGKTLKIGRNGLNTPAYLLATGDVTINGTIDVSGGHGTFSSGGIGGPGGWGGGSPGMLNTPPGDGQGPGGGKVGTKSNYYSGPDKPDLSGSASYASAPNNDLGTNFAGKTYGSALLIPLMGGSGGAGSVHTTQGNSNYMGGGGGGGGAILVATNTKITVAGKISANGGVSGTAVVPYAQMGSGGAIRLVAPEIAGGGSLEAWGGTSSYANQGAHGRIRLDSSLYSGTLYMAYAATTIGFNPVIFPANPPALRLKNVAGTEIAADNETAIIVTLPADGNPVQPVTVEAKNFKGDVKFVVNVVPERGTSTFTEGTIVNPDGNSATATVNVTFPLNASSQVYVWTKQLVSSAPAPAP